MATESEPKGRAHFKLHWKHNDLFLEMTFVMWGWAGLCWAGAGLDSAGLTRAGLDWAGLD